MKPKLGIVPSTPVDSRQLARGKIFTTNYTPKLRYRWDTGEGIGRYLGELKRGRLIARRCDGCQRILIPPRMFCERCFRPTDEWIYVNDTGKVLTFSLCYVTWNVRRLKQPLIPAVIEIDGASAGMGILHLLKKVPPKKVRVGMRVRAVWRPPAERRGSITDILYWRPATEERE